MRNEVVQSEPRWLRIVLILVAASLVTLIILAPLALVFASAIGEGCHACLASVIDPDARSAILLTLIATAIAVTINTICGIAAAWCLAHARFRGRSLLLALIDLPFAVSPVVAGLLFVLLLGPHGWGAPVLRFLHWKVLFSTPGIAIATTRRRLAHSPAGGPARRALEPGAGSAVVHCTGARRIRCGLGRLGPYPRGNLHLAAAHPEPL